MTVTHPLDDRGRDGGELSLHKNGYALGLLGGIGALIFGILGQANHAMMEAYLYGWIFILSLTLGAFGLVLLHHTVRAKWTLSVIRFLEAWSSPGAFALVAVLFLPVALQFSHLYHWADPKYVADDLLLQRKAPFLNVGPTGFPLRFVVYFALWILLSWGMRNSTRRQEKNLDFRLEQGRMTWGALGIVAFMLSATLAWTDFGMSLEPHWSSTMYGVWQIVAGAGAALALSNVCLCINARKSPFREVVFPGLTKDLGNMQFAFTMLWGYTTVSQYLIIWNGNIPEFTAYFAKRSNMLVDPAAAAGHGAGHGAAHAATESLTNAALVAPAGMHTTWWGALGLALIIGRFFIPFFTLLAPRTKKTPEGLARICGWILVLHVIDVYMLVMPAFTSRQAAGPTTLQVIPDLLAVASLFLLWLGVALGTTKGSSLIARYDDRLQEAKAHAH